MPLVSIQANDGIYIKRNSLFFAILALLDRIHALRMFDLFVSIVRLEYVLCTSQRNQPQSVSLYFLRIGNHSHSAQESAYAVSYRQ